MTSRVVVLGAGYAGLPAAKRIARQMRRDEVEVTLVNGTADFVERPRLHQMAVGQSVKVTPLQRYLDGSGVRFVWGWVREIDRARRRVVFAVGDETRVVSYDVLVYALGSNIDVDAVPGVGEHAVSLTSLMSADVLRDRLRDLRVGRMVAVCGGGLTGIEVATEVAESYPSLNVKLISAIQPGLWLSEKGSNHLRRVCDELKIEVIGGVRVHEVQAGGFVCADGSAIGFDVGIWAGGFRVPALARRAGLAVTADGRARVDDRLRSISDPDVYVIGDAAAVPGAWGDRLAMGCRTGGFTGPKAADAVVARLTGREADPFRFRYFHECISLGRRQGLVQFLNADGSPKERILTGRTAIAYKNATLNGARMYFRRSGPAFARRRHVSARSAGVSKLAERASR